MTKGKLSGNSLSSVLGNKEKYQKMVYGPALPLLFARPAFSASPSLHDWLPELHLARLVADLVDALDLGPILATYTRSSNRGPHNCHPLLLTRLLFCAYAIGQPSSCQIEQATHTDLAFRFLAADQHPDHETIATFRQQHLPALAALFGQVLALYEKAGLVKLGHLAIGGTKSKANAAYRRTVSYERLSEREQHWRTQVDELLARAAAVDAAEQ